MFIKVEYQQTTSESIPLNRLEGRRESALAFQLARENTETVQLRKFGGLCRRTTWSPTPLAGWVGTCSSRATRTGGSSKVTFQ